MVLWGLVFVLRWSVKNKNWRYRTTKYPTSQREPQQLGLVKVNLSIPW